MTIVAYVVTRKGKIIANTIDEGYAFSLVRSRNYTWMDVNGVRVITSQ